MKYTDNRRTVSDGGEYDESRSDISLYYEEYGDGSPLILLHGNGEDHTYFSSQTPFFAKKFRVITPDTRGHGATPRGEGEFTLNRFADDLSRFMTENGIAKSHILGFSDGANIAMIFALRHPEMTDRLILNGGNLSPDGIRRTTQIPIEIGYRIARRFAGKSADAKKNAELLGLMVNEPHILPESLSGITSPTLVIAGTRDLVKRSHTELIASAIPDSQLCFVRGDHFAASRNPSEFNEAVMRFLGGEEGAGMHELKYVTKQ